MTNHDDQLGFDALLASADGSNAKRRFDRKTAHLPASMRDALPFFRELLEQYHAAVLDADADTAIALREEAHTLALKLNGGEPGILAHDEAPARVLEREAAALDGAIPIWGQRGVFDIFVGEMAARITIHGVFGIGGYYLLWSGFTAEAIDRAKPFLSETGFRRFYAVPQHFPKGLTPDEFARRVLEDYIAGELKRRLLEIKPEFSG